MPVSSSSATASSHANADVSGEVDQLENEAPSPSKDDNSSGDDEFYECISGDEEETESNTDLAEGSSLHSDAAVSRGEGRLQPLGDEKLLNVEETLYIPVTQEPAPMTEDQLAEHAEVLTRYL